MTNGHLTFPTDTASIPGNAIGTRQENHKLLVDVLTVYPQANKNDSGDSLTQADVTGTKLPTNKNVTLSANKNVAFSVNRNVMVSGNKNVSFTANKDVSFTANKNETLTANQNVSFTANKNETVTTNKNMVLRVNKNVSLTANVTHHIDTKAIQQVMELLEQWNENNTRTSRDDVIILFKTIVHIINQTNERVRRQAMLNMAELANEDWEVNYTTHSPELVNDSYPMHDFEVISEEEILRAKHLYIKKILTYVGITMGSVLVFTVIGFFFITDPKSCVLAFATGSPCCLVLCPCIVKSLSQFLNPGQVVRDQMNTYLPGMLIDRDGNIELYEITPAEMEAITVMINDVIDFIQ